MTKILIDEATVRQWLEWFLWFQSCRDEKAPMTSTQVRDSMRQVLADAALDKMADNARELGLDYEQPAQQEQEPIVDAFMVYLYNAGYRAGHHDTVEGTYTDIYVQDMSTYQSDVVSELVGGNTMKFVQPAQKTVGNNPDPYHLSRILHELAGSASMCWQHVDRAGEFKSTQAANFVAAAIDEIRQRMKDAPPAPAQLQDIEQYRLQMVAISTAALGYRKKSDSIHPDYVTSALHDVADLYAKYDELVKQKAEQPAQQWNPVEHYKDGWRDAMQSVQKASPPAQLLPKGEWPKPPSPYQGEEYIGYAKSDLVDYATQVLAAHGITKVN